MALTRSTDPLVWIDCEMTGLNPSKDTILSISCILTTADLSPLDSQGFNAVVGHTPDQLSQMSEWCVNTHGASGLTQQCLASTLTAELVATELLAYIKRFIPEPRRALLAGNSIHADRAFLMVAPWNVILEHLHYRLFDVSAMKEMVRRWAGQQILVGAPVKELRHTAREDVLESIQEARYYKTLIESLTLGTTIPGNGPPTHVPVAIPVVVNGGGNVSVVPQPVDLFAANGSVPLQQQQQHQPPPPPPLPDAKRGQNPFAVPQPNGTSPGDVGDRDPGFRTDVP